MTKQPWVSIRAEFVKSKDQRQLRLLSWRPDGDVRAVLAIVDDGKSHSASRQRIGSDVSVRGIAVYALDLRGTARLDDAAILLSTIRLREPSRPVFLLGHGEGAVVAGLQGIASPMPLQGLILASAALELSMHDLVLRSFRLLAALSPHRAAQIRAGDLLRASAARLSLPLLVLHGSADTVALPSGSEYLHEHAGSSDKTLMIFEGYHHDLFKDPGSDLVVEKLSQWIDERLVTTAHRARIGIEYINQEP